MNNNYPICKNKSTYKTLSSSSNEKNINVYACKYCDFEHLNIWDDIDLEKQFSNVLEQTNNFYRKTLNEKRLGDLLFARTSL